MRLNKIMQSWRINSYRFDVRIYLNRECFGDILRRRSFFSRVFYLFYFLLILLPLNMLHLASKTVFCFCFVDFSYLLVSALSCVCTYDFRKVTYFPIIFKNRADQRTKSGMPHKICNIIGD